ncbi:hypothetical protein [Sorangium sp. So ce1182]|uniref:hypothetical protein n=1 Tax=Sorangium sp. So ce1182 TaxID=3133334 RepID=UPI003F61EDB6
MMKLSCLVGLAALLAAPLLAAPAHADIAPPDTCDTPGSSCSNAGPAADEPGTCTTQKCQRAVPDPDGGVTTVEYDCNRCTAAGGASTSTGTAGTGTAGTGTAGTGTAGTGTAGTGTAGTGTAGTGSAGTDTASSDDAGCATNSAASGGAMAGLMLLCGVAALAAARRRR